MAHDEILWKAAAELRKEMEGNIKEEITRRGRVSFHVDMRSAIAHQIQHKREWFCKVQEEMESRDDLDVCQIVASRAVHDFLMDTLSDIEQQFIARYSNTGTV